HKRRSVGSAASASSTTQCQSGEQKERTHSGPPSLSCSVINGRHAAVLEQVWPHLPVEVAALVLAVAALEQQQARSGTGGRQTISLDCRHTCQLSSHKSSCYTGRSDQSSYTLPPPRSPTARGRCALTKSCRLWQSIAIERYNYQTSRSD